MAKITLKAARVNKGLSQREVAKELQVSNKTVCAWENYTSYPKADKIDAICRLYEMSYDEIIFSL